MKNIYENKKMWKFYFMLIIFLAPLLVAVVKLAGFGIMDTLVFTLFTLMVPYIIITLLIREMVLPQIDEKDIINRHEMKIIGAMSYLMILLLIIYSILNVILILNGEQITSFVIMFFAMWILVQDSGVIITKNKIYYGNKIIEQKEIIRIEEKSANDIIVCLANGDVTRIRYKKAATYIKALESQESY